MKQVIKRRNRYILILILIVQLLVSLWVADKKDYLFFDEVFSYISANNIDGSSSNFKENVWMDESWFVNYMGVQDEHRFEYTIPYYNQIEDVHPPLFYFFLHMACSFVPGQFSYFAGIVFNIVFFLASTIVLFFLCRKVYEDDGCALIVSFLYAISYGGLNTMVFVRMYMLLTLFTLLHMYVYIKYFESDEVSIKSCVLLAITLLGGVLTQYYFLFVAFLLAVWYGIKFLIRKQYMNLIKYVGTIFASAGICLLTWPSILSHLFLGGRGQEAQGNLLSLDGYLPALKEMFRILSNEMFTKLLVVILFGLVGLFLICLKKGEAINRVLWKKSAVILFLCVGYYAIVSKVAPYLVERYIMPIYPLVYLLIVGASYSLLKKLIPVKLAGIMCVVGFAGLSIVHIVHSGIPYTYEKNQNNRERHQIVEEYSDCYAIYISDDKGAHFYDAVQMLKEYRGYYYVFDLQNIETVKSDMNLLKNEEQVLIYVKDKRTTEEANQFIQSVFPSCSLNENSLIDVDEKWSVYLLEIENYGEKI